MTKDKLSKYLFNLKGLACKTCSGEEEKCFSCGMKLGTILRILDYHFSITEQERTEAREWLMIYFLRPQNSSEKFTRICDTILKALGGER